MSNSNLAVGQAQKSRFSVAITTDKYQKMINSTLQDPERVKRFIATITSAVAVNPALQDCEASSILATALLGESLNLSPSPQLGQFYLVPFKQKGVSKAQFVLGYKGYIQLAIRSGQYIKLNVIEIKKGELESFDPLAEEIKCNLIEDAEERENAETIGYYAMFQYMNGFKKEMYWSKNKMLQHADNFSSAFSADAYRKIQNGQVSNADLWKYSSPWYKDFDAMAKKTMLRNLISHWGVMSTEMQTALEQDLSCADVDSNNSIVTTPEESAALEAEVPQEPQPVEQVSLNDL